MTFWAQKTTKIKFLGRGVLRDEFLPMWELSGWQSEHFLISSYGLKTTSRHSKLHFWLFWKERVFFDFFWFFFFFLFWLSFFLNYYIVDTPFWIFLPFFRSSYSFFGSSYLFLNLPTPFRIFIVVFFGFHTATRFPTWSQKQFTLS